MIKNNIINIAIPRGRILKELKFIFKKIKLIPEKSLFDDSCRKLSFDTNKRNIKVIKVRAFDVCTFVAFGAAQFGIAGSDVVDEFNYSEVYTPIDLNIGHCRLSVAALKTLLKKEDPETWSNIRIATKYPNITKNHFAKKGVQVETIKLNGSIELAPKHLMCRRVVDLLSTGNTLKENGLVEVEKIMDVNSKLIVNRSVLKNNIKEVEDIINLIESIKIRIEFF